MEIATTRAAVATAVGNARRAGARVALVPTMGYLHEGHLRLFDTARGAAAFVVASVFVNPLQFGPAEDLDRYPRDLDRDARLAGERGVDLLFAPPVEEMYPAGRSHVLITAPALSRRLCGAFRPGHFDGVLTVVAKLFNIVRPDVAIFGRKDFQQAVLIRAMTRDLDFGVEIEVAPTVRDADGLALSSRNVHLSPVQRHAALSLSRALRAAQDAYSAGETAGDALIGVMRRIFAEHPGVTLQYAEAVDPESLEAVVTAREGTVLAVAAFVGDTRLIDNHVLS